ncbi:hypothetical protein [Pseudothauera hydrothermalis]|uniref:hypothetical protein n=1 Tax=Pseudothauera hydrothermalis TaxID=2184083 RepID=UPI000E091D8E|nr:hypothetical protein [Pseudothauera hydrothermalis]
MTATHRTADVGALMAAALNRDCTCRSLDEARLRRQLEREPALHGLAGEIRNSRPHLFSPTAVFLAPADLTAMAAIVRAVETVVALPAWRAEVLARSPAIAAFDPGPRGAFLGFDFHLCADGPKLIEINTNPGGALLNGALARAQQACCTEFAALMRPSADLDALDAHWQQMFLEEWRLQRGSGRPQRIAIVDQAPAAQYLYPEFLLFQHLFREAGIDAVIADPAELAWDGHTLLHAGRPVDMVYNRLTDFYLSDPSAAVLRAAFEAGAAVLTPLPRAHALYADKRNLSLLSSPEQLTRLGAPEAAIATLAAGVPRTIEVDTVHAEALWAGRRALFFKPATGFGSRAAYRGDKLTRRVWTEILAGGYVAQALALPSERRVQVDGQDSNLKLDLRAYAYRGHIQLVAARLYRGQTTNFRTPGGGFAPVFLTQDAASIAALQPAPN